MAMTPFERMAIISIIDNMQGQLQGLKTLIAASGKGEAPTHTRTTIPVPNGSGSHYTSPDEDQQLDRLVGMQDLVKEAERVPVDLWAEMVAERQAEEQARAQQQGS